MRANTIDEMRHDAAGWWIAEAGRPAARPPLSGTVDADVVVIGGGYTGLWTAWHVLEREPHARVAVLEADRCGCGPSGRNGGFVSTMWLRLPYLEERCGTAAAVAIARAAARSVPAIGAWCEREGVDAWYRAAPSLVVSTAPAQDGAGRAAVAAAARAGAPGEVAALAPDAVRAVCASPVFRGGVRVATAATVQPARLAFGLRERLLARGALIFEGSRVRALRGDGRAGVVATTAGGAVRAGAATLAVSAASGALAPLRDRLTVGSSHVVVTEPVPDVLERLGWTGGEPIADGRALLHYFRTTRDGRIVFGWAGGPMGAGARTRGRLEVDAATIGRVRADLLRVFPALRGRALAHAWGGPVDVSPAHVPEVRTLPGGRVHAAFGYTGNGVGPAHLLGAVLASLALDRRDELTRLALVDPPPARVPPEPLRVAGAALIRRALVRKEALEERGERPDPLTRAVAAVPGLIGVHIVR